jgi:hypothetical protein
MFPPAQNCNSGELVFDLTSAFKNVGRLAGAGEGTGYSREARSTVRAENLRPVFRLASSDSWEMKIGWSLVRHYPISNTEPLRLPRLCPRILDRGTCRHILGKIADMKLEVLSLAFRLDCLSCVLTTFSTILVGTGKTGCWRLRIASSFASLG